MVFTAQSRKDLSDIGLTIARDSPERAIRFARGLRNKCRKIAEAPKAYRQRPELAAGLRSCAYWNYVVFFVVEPGQVRIVRVLHGAMDIEERLADEDAT